MLVSGIDSTSSNNVSFGKFTKEAKAVVNNGLVRKILKKQYGVSKKDIQKLDRSPFVFDLLSNSIDADLPETAGLVLIPPKRFKLQKICISSPETDLKTVGEEFFAYCIAKAKNMELSYKSLLSKLKTHPLRKEWRENITKIERKNKPMLNEYVKGYNDKTSGVNLSAIEKKFSDVYEQEVKIDNECAANSDILKNELASAVSEDWDILKGEKFNLGKNHIEYSKTKSLMQKCRA